MKKLFSCILSLCVLAAMLLLPGCTNKPENENKTSMFRGLAPDEMIITGYIGPRPTYTRNGEVIWNGLEDATVFHYIKEAGINYIEDNDFTFSGNTYEGAKKALELAEEAGLMYFMPAYDVIRMDGEILASDAEIKAKLEEMYQYNSFGGLYFRDEPYSSMFPHIQKCLERYNHVKDELGYTDLNVFLNLFPPVGGNQLSNGTDKDMTWDEYIRGLSDTGVEYLSFDMYPIMGLFGNKVSANWFTALGTINEIALEEGKPWMGCVQVGGGSTSYGTIEARVTTEGEMKWDVNTMLAFGAKGLTYYLLVSPPYFANTEEAQIDCHSLINVYGEKTPLWDYAKEINEHVKAIDHILLNCDYKGVIITGDSPCVHYGKDLIKDNTFRDLNGVTGNALVGCFDYNGKTALYVVNNSITEEGQINLTFNHKCNFEVIQDAASRTENGDSLTLDLGIGEAALVVLESRDLTMTIVIVSVVVALLGAGIAVAILVVKKRKKE